MYIPETSTMPQLVSDFITKPISFENSCVEVFLVFSFILESQIVRYCMWRENLKENHDSYRWKFRSFFSLSPIPSVSYGIPSYTHTHTHTLPSHLKLHAWWSHYWSPREALLRNNGPCYRYFFPLIFYIKFILLNFIPLSLRPPVSSSQHVARCCIW